MQHGHFSPGVLGLPLLDARGSVAEDFKVTVVGCGVGFLTG